MRRLAAAIALLAAGACAAPGATAPPLATLAVEPAAARWSPFVLPGPSALRPAEPGAPGEAEWAELRSLEARRDEDDRKAIAYWDTAPVLRWSELARDEVQDHPLALPRAARALAMVHAALYDATIAVWDAKAAYGRAAPYRFDASLKPWAGDVDLPSYPSEHAALAYAAATVLGELFPPSAERMARYAGGAAESRVAAGAAFRGDVEAGKALGLAVARQVLARAAADASDTLGELPMRVEPGQWRHDYPEEMVAGAWKPWLIPDLAPFRLPAPPAPGTPAFAAELEAAAARYAEPRPSAAPAMADASRAAAAWNDAAREILRQKGASTPEAARVLGYLHLSLADAALCSWDTQYRVLRARPAMVAPGRFSPPPEAPAHPAYPAPEAVCAGAAVAVLEALGPASERERWEREAAAIAEWGFAAGRNFQRDGLDGLALGRRVGAAEAARAAIDAKGP